MKFYFETDPNYSPRKEGKLAKVSIWPDTNSRSGGELFVLIAKELERISSGDQVSFAMVGKEKRTPMAFPPRDRNDKRLLVMGSIPQPAHRSHGGVCAEKSTVKPIAKSVGGGAWGSGEVFLAVLEEGQRIVSYPKLLVWENVAGALETRQFDTEAEYLLHYDGNQDIEFI